MIILNMQIFENLLVAAPQNQSQTCGLPLLFYDIANFYQLLTIFFLILSGDSMNHVNQRPAYVIVLWKTVYSKFKREKIYIH